MTTQTVNWTATVPMSSPDERQHPKLRWPARITSALGHLLVI